MDPRPPPPPTAAKPVPGAAAQASATAVIDGIERPLVVPLGNGGDPRSIVAGVADEVGTAELVVDRSGVALRGAIAGRDLLSGDRLVPAGHRSLPALIAVAGPLRGARVTVDRELHLGRGGRFGSATIDDPEVSRHHLRLWPTPGALVAVDVGSTNGTTRNDEPLVGPVALRAGDRLELGASVLIVIGDPPRADHLRPAGPQVQHRAAPSSDPSPPAGRAWNDEPDLAVVAAAIAGWSPLLWSQPLPAGSGPRVRLGAADAASSGPWLATRSLDLGQHRQVAVVGELAAAAELVAAWLLQLGARHSPEDLALRVAHDPDGPAGATALGWLADAAAWLPHHDGPSDHRAPAWELTVLGDARRPAAAGAHTTTVWLLAPDDPVPRGCRAVIEVGGTADEPSRLLEPDDELTFVADRVDPVTFAVLTKFLAPLCTHPRPASS